MEKILLWLFERKFLVFFGTNSHFLSKNRWFLQNSLKTRDFRGFVLQHELKIFDTEENPKTRDSCYNTRNDNTVHDQGEHDTKMLKSQFNSRSKSSVIKSRVITRIPCFGVFLRVKIFELVLQHEPPKIPCFQRISKKFAKFHYFCSNIWHFCPKKPNF